MTATDPAPLLCPTCRSHDTMVGVGGNGLCFACSHTWDPTRVVAGPAPAVQAAPEPTDDDVQDPYAESNAAMVDAVESKLADELEQFTAGIDAEIAGRMAEMVGGVATLEGGQVGTVTYVYAEDQTVQVELGDGRFEIVPWSDLVRITPKIEPAALAPAGLVDELAGGGDTPATVEPPVGAATDEPPLAALVLTGELAALIVKAAVASPDTYQADGFKAYPPAGFLPATRDLFPVVEQAAVTAVRGLIAVFELDPDVILTAIYGEAYEPTQGDQTTTEVTGEPSSPDTSE